MATADVITFTIPNQFACLRLDHAMSQIIADFSRTKITNWIKDGRVSLNDQITNPKTKVYGGERIKLVLPESNQDLATQAENIPLKIIYQDQQILIIDKAAALVVHPANGNWSGTLLNAILYHYPQAIDLDRAGIVHRLDKDTTGLMVIAKTHLAQQSLVDQLQSRQVTRIYRLLVEGHPPKSGIINKNISRDSFNRTKMTAVDFGGKEAITKYRVLEYFDQISYVECKLETGRTHQIRVHLKDIGHPIIADPVYGTKKINYDTEIVQAIKNLNRQALHALKLKLIHPTTKEEMSFNSELPLDFKLLLESLIKTKNNPNLELTDEYY